MKKKMLVKTIRVWKWRKKCLTVLKFCAHFESKNIFEELLFNAAHTPTVWRAWSMPRNWSNELRLFQYWFFYWFSWKEIRYWKGSSHCANRRHRTRIQNNRISPGTPCLFRKHFVIFIETQCLRTFVIRTDEMGRKFCFVIILSFNFMRKKAVQPKSVNSSLFRIERNCFTSLRLLCDWIRR